MQWRDTMFALSGPAACTCRIAACRACIVSARAACAAPRCGKRRRSGKRPPWRLPASSSSAPPRTPTRPAARPICASPKCLRSDPALKDKKVISVKQYFPVSDPKNPPRYLVFCDIYKGEFDPFRGVPAQKRRFGGVCPQSDEARSQGPDGQLAVLLPLSGKSRSGNRP